MASSYSPQSAPMDDPDHGWKPNRRPQSTIAQNFMTELDSLFKLDGGIEDLDRTVHEKKAAVNTQTRELEALEARLRATEERLNQAKGNSPPSKTSSQQKAQQTEPQPRVPESPLAQKTSNMPERPSSAKPDAA